ncbi:ABC transporter substrate-binding protein [Pseudonocardia sp. HH130630-07]|uniref:ABC transporter substrate-binding protein n=1 Tax=Pseudonocardia sp. HH130630-07 TaxID=1690815 RepID=UPI000814E43C|nr:ABC transporter substrate-binding protein [Pseudonocardia sp. HH130630-07]ANY05457.1 hypothetical protein AFB00_03080 [Pseudonocardia sp. HH130630-07]
MGATPGRRFSVLAAAVVAALLSAACGGGAPAPAPAGGSGETGYPVTVTHAYGETTIPARPQRVVALGLNDLAIAQAVGAPVVGGLRNEGESGPGVPYAPALPADVLTIDAAEQVSPEAVAALRPDLILAVASPLVTDEATYRRMAAIAPTVSYTASLYAASMQEDARQIGRALGRSAEVEGLVSRAEESIAQVRRDLPGLAGRSYLFGQARGDVLPMVVGADNQSTVFMTALGLQVPPSFRGDAGDSGLAPGTVGLSYEEAGRLAEADLLLMTFVSTGDRTRFEGSPVVRPALAGAEYVPTSLDLAIALQSPNLVSTPWLLEQLRPSLERTAAG